MKSTGIGSLGSRTWLTRGSGGELQKHSGGTCGVWSGSDPNWTEKPIEASLGMDPASAIKSWWLQPEPIHPWRTAPQEHLGDLIDTLGCLPQLTPDSKLHSTVGCHDPAPDLNSSVCSHPAPAELKVVKIKAAKVFPSAPTAHKYGRI